MKLQELSSHLEEIFRERGAKPVGALFTSATLPDGRLVSARLLFLDAPRSARLPPPHRGLVLNEIWLELEDAVQKALSPGQAKLEEYIAAERRLSGNRDLASEWPEWFLSRRFDLTANYQLSLPSEPAVTRGQRPFSSHHRLCEWWVTGRENSDGGDAKHFRELAIVVPDQRGTLTSVAWSAEALVAHISSASPQELELQVLFKSPGGNLAVHSPVQQGENCIPIPAKARFAEVFLIHGEDALLAHSRTNADGPERLGNDVSPDGIAQLLRDGENELVEFKPWVALEKGKREELLKAVIAFANTAGGTLLVGVDNEGSVQSKAELDRAARGDREAYTLKLVDWLRTNTTPTARMRHDEVEIGDERVLVIRVERGFGVFCTREGSNLWVRRGSNNMKPNGEELIQMSKRSTHLPPAWPITNGLF